VDPDLVAGLEIGYRGDRKRDAVAGDAHVDTRTDEIEAGVDRVEREQRAEEQEWQKQKSGAFRHASSLDASLDEL